MRHFATTFLERVLIGGNNVGESTGILAILTAPIRRFGGYTTSCASLMPRPSPGLGRSSATVLTMAWTGPPTAVRFSS